MQDSMTQHFTRHPILQPTIGPGTCPSVGGHYLSRGHELGKALVRLHQLIVCAPLFNLPILHVDHRVSPAHKLQLISHQDPGFAFQGPHQAGVIHLPCHLS